MADFLDNLSHLDRRSLGRLGEKIASFYFQKKGYKILDKNYSSSFVSGPQRGEIDLIVRKRDKISFVEVKTLISRGPTPVFSPEQKVNRHKEQKIIRTAQEWLAENKISQESKWQVDILAIQINPETKKAKIRHFENIASAKIF